MASHKRRLNAWETLLALLDKDEHLEWIVFGKWSHGSNPAAIRSTNPGWVPDEKIGKLLDAGDAEPLMQNWQLFGAGSYKVTYPIQAWTSTHIICTHATVLGVLPVKVLREPQAFVPDYWSKSKPRAKRRTDGDAHERLVGDVRVQLLNAGVKVESEEAK